MEGWTWELSRNGIYENNRGGLERERGSMRKKRSRSLEAGVMDSENHI